MKQLEKLTMLQVLNQSAEKFSDSLFLSNIDKDSFTYSQFAQKAKEVSTFLSNEGIIPGDRVAILGENMANWGIAYYAITTMGAVAVPIMTEFQESQVHHVLRHSESKAIFVTAKYYGKVEEAECENLTTLILLDDFSIIPPKTKSDRIKEVLAEGKKEFSKIKAAALKFVGAMSAEVREDDLASIVYTSGTTGHSKGVMLTHKNIVFDAYASLQLVDVNETDRLLSILPLFHTIESTLGLTIPLLVGASVHYMDKPPTAAVLLPALAKIKPTVMISVPLVIEKIYRMKIMPEIQSKAVVRGLYKIPTVRKKLNKAIGKKLLKTFGGELKIFCIGGAALSADVEKFLSEAKFPFAIGYGLTETAPLVTGTDNFNTRDRSAGTVLNGMEIKINNPDEATGEGEVYIKGPNVMKGYYKDPETTKEIMSDDGWFKSGDNAYIDDDGYLFIKGRLKNVIVGANGKNIYPEEIESVMNEFGYVAESIVFERDDKLVAKVYFDYDLIDKEFEIQKLTEPEARKKMNEIIQDLLKETNERVPTFSRLNKIIEQPEPFEKTPTQKIKRFLYI
ncbi:AMP-binding protein [Bacteroidota bacterium]